MLVHHHDPKFKHSQTLFSPTSSAISILAPSVQTVQLPSLLQNQSRVRLTNRSQEQAAIQAELHVRRARRLSAGRRDMLADVGGRDENLRERHGVVGQEVKLQVFLRVGIGVDDARDVDDEADRLGGGASAWFANSGQS